MQSTKSFTFPATNVPSFHITLPSQSTIFVSGAYIFHLSLTLSPFPPTKPPPYVTGTEVLLLSFSKTIQCGLKTEKIVVRNRIQILVGEVDVYHLFFLVML